MMLKIDDLRNLKVNKEIVQEAVRLAEQRLTDSLDTRVQLEKKAFFLLPSYTAFTIAGCSALAYMYTNEEFNLFAGVLVLLCLMLIAGTVFLYSSLRCSDYGCLGRKPTTWLEPGVLDGSKNTYCVMMAYILYDYTKTIDVSISSNRKKASRLNMAIILGALTPAAFLVGVLISLFSQ